MRAAHAADNPAEVLELPTVNVVGTTPLPGIGVPLRDVPANVQIFNRREFDQQRPDNIAPFLLQNGASVSLNSSQNNGYQPDLNFRGLTASPLLGTPQGLSVFQDGVRINEPFGDIVNWDLVPQAAISSAQLIPGVNPVFGLNTLGGALAIYTKSGAQYPGGSLMLSGGSNARRGLEVEYGGKQDELDYFLTGNAMDDRGWAEHNPSRLRQFFGKVGWQDEKTDLDVTLTLADNRLQGTQTLPLSFLAQPKQAYTYPDINTNQLEFVAMKGSHFLRDDLLLSSNAYYRHLRATNFASNVNDNYGETDPATGLMALNQAFNDSSVTNQNGYGAGLQLTSEQQWLACKNQLVLGTTGDFGDTGFRQQEQTADFTHDRGTTATGELIPTTDVRTKSAIVGAYVADTLALTPRWTLTVAGRYNRARIEIRDRSGENGAIDGTHVFARFNPATGINFNPTPALTAYASYTEGARAPTPIELTCADPNAPCKLPNLFLADPPLNQVVAKTIEMGARGRVGEFAHWSTAVYRSELTDDIQFIASGEGAINAGFFKNVGSTRRDGFEISGDTRLGDWRFALRYSFIDATFRSNFLAHSPNNSSADTNGTIAVAPGDRIPAIPRQTLKVRVDYTREKRFAIGANAIYASSIYARGDENNRDDHGRVPGYMLVNLDGELTLAANWTLLARVDNLFDRNYQNFALLGANFFTGAERSFGPANGTQPAAEQFRSPGAPRTVWLGLRVRFV